MAASTKRRAAYRVQGLRRRAGSRRCRDHRRRTCGAFHGAETRAASGDRHRRRAARRRCVEHVGSGRHRCCSRRRRQHGKACRRHDRSGRAASSIPRSLTSLPRKDRIASAIFSSYGVPFDRDLEGHYILSKEAAHSEKRVVRVSGDKAGAAIMQALIAAVRATPSIRVLEGYEADDLIAANGRVEGVRLIRPTALGNGTLCLCSRVGCRARDGRRRRVVRADNQPVLCQRRGPRDGCARGRGDRRPGVRAISSDSH